MELSEVKYKKCKGCGRMHPQAEWLGWVNNYDREARACKGYKAVKREFCKPCERMAEGG